MMRMGDRDRERVGCIGRFRLGLGQQNLEHHQDLILVGMAGADHGLFHLIGSIFRHRNPEHRRRQHRDAPGLAEFQGGDAILVDEGLLHRGFRRLEIAQHGGEALMDRQQAARKAQFRREAERGSSLAGPSLLPVYELNESDGYHFMAFKYVESISLRDLIGWRHAYIMRGDLDHLDPLVTLNLDDYLIAITRHLASAAAALAQVHDQQIVHRDIKPSNILLAKRNREGVFLCDFGLGRDLEFATPEQMRDGAGTPMYMPPERLLRITADEKKGDIYSLGVTLCEAVTLKRPFVVPDDLPLNIIAPYLSIQIPVRPRVLEPDLPDELEAIIMKAMARKPSERFPDAHELAVSLEDFASRWTPRTGPAANRARPVDQR